LFFLPVHSASSVAATLPPHTPNKVIFASSFLMAQMMCKMGCHRRLGYARLLNRSGFGFVTVFVTHVRQSLSSLQRPEPKKRLFRQLPFSSATSELPQQERLLSRSSTLHALVFPFASRRIVHSVTLHFLNRISNPHLP